MEFLSNELQKSLCASEHFNAQVKRDGRPARTVLFHGDDNEESGSDFALALDSASGGPFRFALSTGVPYAESPVPATSSSHPQLSEASLGHGRR